MASVEPQRQNETNVDRKAIAKTKAKYKFPWWASENALEIFWGQAHEKIWIVPVEKFLMVAKKAMERDVSAQELDDMQGLADELVERIPAAKLSELLSKF
jgi:hypothetical protein